jgi:Cystathionine beta-lyases/cystathionine gamma-synthases
MSYHPRYFSVQKKTHSCNPKNKTYHDQSEQKDGLSPSEAGKRAHRLRNDQGHNTSSTFGMRMDTLLSHAGLKTGKGRNHGTKDQGDAINVPLHSMNEPLCPPLHLETTYTRPPSGDYFNPQDGGNGWIYSRIGNPTRKLLEDCMSQLEINTHGTKVMEGNIMGTTTCAKNDEDWSKDDDDDDDDDDATSGITCAFSSGMAAVAAVLLALPQRLHVLLPNDIYHGVPTQLKTMFVQRNLTYSTIDMTNIDNVQDEIRQFMEKYKDDETAVHDNRPHLLVWMESPSNPQCKVVDIKATCGHVSKYREENDPMKYGITTVVDSTWAPPPITQPLLVSIFQCMVLYDCLYHI